VSTPAWILEIFGGVMLLVAEVSAARLVLARAWTRRGGTDADIAVSRVLMGIAMAGLLVPGLSSLPNAGWEAVFAVMTAWFAWCLWRESRRRGAAVVVGGDYAPPLVQSGALLYLFAAVTGPPGTGAGTSTPGPGGMPGMAGGAPAFHVTTLALVFVLLLIAFTVHDLDQPLPADAAGPACGADPAAFTAERLLLSPAVVKGCQVATGVTIAFLLIIMI